MIKNRLYGAKWSIGAEISTPFNNKNGIYQDGTTPMYRNKDGILWAISGHTHMGHIGIFKGNCLDDLKEVYEMKTNFNTGAAGEAFCGTKYPDGVLSRGSVWPFGLYICPNTNRFFCFFHNETGWNGKGTGYTIYALADGEPDFRHIGLMHSDDLGQSWDFDRWIMTSHEVCYSELYRPDGITTGGQPQGDICCGCGDFSIFVEPDDDYIYLFYNLLYHNTDKKCWSDLGVYVSRTEKRTDGIMGDFSNYYNGSFCEPGNLGKASKIADDAWHPRVIYSNSIDAYIMSSKSFVASRANSETLRIRTSSDLINWSEPIKINGNGKEFYTHYYSFLSNKTNGPHNVIDNEFSILAGHNGTDVKRYITNFEF